MKTISEVERTISTTRWMREIVIVDCGDFRFEIPKYLAKTYPIGRKVQMTVKPK